MTAPNFPLPPPPAPLLAPYQPPTFDDALLDHAQRKWAAECENAERISKERHIVLTIMVAFLGFGLFKIEWLQGIVSRTNLPGHWETAAHCAISTLLVLAVGLFLGAVFSLAHRPRGQTASAKLALPPATYSVPLPANELQRRAVFLTTYAAAQVLMESNQRLRDRLITAWTFFGFGVGVVGIITILYIVAKVSSIKTGGT